MNLTDISPFNYYSAPSRHQTPLPRPRAVVSAEFAIFVSYDRKDVQTMEQDSRGVRFRGIRVHIPQHHRAHRILLGLRRVHRIFI